MNKEFFNLKDTLECGQCFRWEQNPDGSYTGVVGDEVVTVKQTADDIYYDCSDELFNSYFDMNSDYSKIAEKVCVDSVMERAVSKGKGIRILNQDFFETVVSFIISQNNNIPRIKGIIGKLCEKYGTPIKDGFYTFPNAETLAKVKPEELAFLRAGYRDTYIIDAADKIFSGKIDINIIKNGNILSARKEISKIRGVGPKVADCILLFAAKRGETFPTDVWIKKVLTHYYGLSDITPKKAQEFAENKFGKYAGFAQQYLFYLARSEGI